MKNRLILIVIIVATAAAGLTYSCSQTNRQDESTRAASPEQVSSEQFVGTETCASCHEGAAADWQGSHHDWAMAAVDSISVRGDFNNVTFRHDGQQYRFYRQDDKYMVEAPGPDGQQRSYQVTHTFGWSPLQQYLVKFGNGKLQALQVAWNTRKQEWFSMHPDEEVKPGDWLHWSGGAMNWNTMCADCHSTQLEQNYLPEADSFHTTWTSIDVSCESCHGPGKAHVEFMESGESDTGSVQRIRKDLDLTSKTSQLAQIDKCARCHALREKLVDGYDHDKKFMDHFNPDLPHPDMYFADGQIKGEVYVYGSFLQSKMFQEGVECSDCHNPHSLELKANVTDNTLCMQCHEPTYDTREHTRHEPNTEASQCISCHMTGRYYMVVDHRRDHSFRVPRPDLSAKFGTPNACNDCHSTKSPSWAADAVREWYGPEREYHFSETLLKADSMKTEAVPVLKRLIADTSQPVIARATAIWYLGQFPSRQGVEILQNSVQQSHPLIQKSAARALASLPGNMKKTPLADLLDDSLRAVRVTAANGLAEYSAADFPAGTKQLFKTSLGELETYLEVNQYFPSGLMNRGQYFEKQGQMQRAIDAYEKALKKDPNFTPARVNLAYLYNEQGRVQDARELLEQVIEQEPAYGPAYYSLALLISGQGELQASIPKFKRAAELMPAHARSRYNLAIVYQKLEEPQKAEIWYNAAIEIAPDTPDFHYGIVTLYLQQREYEKALPHVKTLTELQPDNARFRRLMQMVRKGIK